MKKRVLTLVLLALLALTCAFAACGGGGGKDNKAATCTVVVSGGSGSGVYEKGKVITVVADDLQDKRFVEWNINDTRTSNEKTLTITVDGNMFLEAVYVDIYTLTVNGGSGSGRYDGGSTITVNADVPDGKVFKCWESGGEVYSYDNPLSIILDSNLSITAVIAEQAIVNVENGNGSGVYAVGATVAITANVPDGKIFAYWLLNGERYSDDYYLNYVIDRAESIFTPVFGDPVRLTVNGGSGNGIYIKGATVVIVPIEPEWKSFVRWEMDGETVSTDRVCSVVIDEDTVIDAVFTDVIQRTLTVVGGEGSGVYADGELITVVSTVPENLTFLNWTVNGEIVSTEDPYTFTITSDMTITANFVEIYLEEDFKLSAPLLDSYETGNVIELPAATFKSSTATVSVKDPDGNDVELVSGKYLSLNKAGAYSLTYTADKDNRVKVSLTVNSVENLNVISSTDNAATCTVSGNNIHSVSGWNKNTKLTFNTVADFDAVRGNTILIAPVIAKGFSTSTFDYLSIKITDYKNSDNVIEIQMYDDAVDSTKYHFAVYINGVKKGEAIAFNGSGQCNLWIKYMETTGDKFNPIQLWFGGVASADAHLDLTDFAGFTDDKAIITVEASGWHVDSASIGFDWFMDVRTYTTDLSDLYANFGNSFILSKPLLENYEQGHTIELPTATCDEQECSVSVYYGGNPVDITGGKLYFANVGEYTVKYSAADNSVVFKEFVVNACAALNVISSTDNAATCTVSGNIHNVSGWNKNTKLTFNMVADFDAVRGNVILIAPVIAKGFSTSTFDNLSIKITDYKNSDNVIEIQMYDDPVDATKYHFVVYINGVKKGETIAFNGSGQCNIWIKYMETTGDKFNPIQLWFGGVASADAHLDLTGFSGFTDDKAIITVEASGWHVDSASIGFDWFMDVRTYATDLSDLYCDED